MLHSCPTEANLICMCQDEIHNKHDTNQSHTHSRWHESMCLSPFKQGSIQSCALAGSECNLIGSLRVRSRATQKEHTVRNTLAHICGGPSAAMHRCAQTHPSTCECEVMAAVLPLSYCPCGGEAPEHLNN